MANVMLRLNPAAFTGSGLLAGQPIHKAHYTMVCTGERKQHVAHNSWAGQRDPGSTQPANTISIAFQGTSPIWFTVEAFNSLPISEGLGQIANDMERGLILVDKSSGAAASATEVRAGNLT